MKFNDFSGNQSIKDALSAAFGSGSASHAYILSGPAGSGKKTLARLMAQAFCCLETDKPCGRCSNCQKIGRDIHPDVITLDNGESAILVDQVRSGLRAGAWVRPNEAARKIYIVAHAQNMNEAAQNALLHLLEEPPVYAAFLLLCENIDAILPTVRSRCIELTLQQVPAEEAIAFLSARFPEKPESELLHAFSLSGGYIGGALARLEDADQDDYSDQVALFAQKLAEGDELAFFCFSVSLEKLKRNGLSAFLDAAIGFLHGCVAYHCTGACPSGPLREQVYALCSRRREKELFALTQSLMQIRQYCDYNVGPAHLAGLLTVACFEGTA